MAYFVDKFELGESNEYEYKFVGKYGAKGEKRAKKQNITPEQVKKQNQFNREKNVRRIIKANFNPYDICACLKYPAGTRKKTEQVKADLKKFLRQMREQYAKVDEQFKFIYRMEIGKQGGIHIHILVNRLREKLDTDMLMQKLWKHGVVDYKSLYAQGGYEKLAAYIVKQPKEDEAYKQLSWLPEEEQKEYIKYSSSRNLIRPKPVRKKYTHWTMRKILRDGPEPTKGYYIDKNSIVTGVNKFTGMSYLYYTEYKAGYQNTWKNDYEEDG